MSLSALSRNKDTKSAPKYMEPELCTALEMQSMHFFLDSDTQVQAACVRGMSQGLEYG